MPKVHFKNTTITCAIGDNLRSVLKKNKLSPYNSNAQLLNCHGLGTCGTCAVEITGAVSKKTAVEKWRLNFPPHQEEHGLRLACQTTVLGDLSIKKHDGFWGQKKT